MNKEKQIEEIRDAKFIIRDTIYSISNEEDRKYLEQILYDLDYRKASEVAEEIFEDFKAAMRVEIARNEALLKMEDDDDFYEGRNDAYRTAINCLAELKKKYTEDGK